MGIWPARIGDTPPFTQRMPGAAWAMAPQEMDAVKLRLGQSAPRHSRPIAWLHEPHRTSRPAAIALRRRLDLPE